MTGEVINLRQARKRKARDQRAEKAQENRVAFGRTKSEKDAVRRDKEKLANLVDWHRRDLRANDGETPPENDS